MRLYSIRKPEMTNVPHNGGTPCERGEMPARWLIIGSGGELSS